ncbi:MAG: cyclase family protein [bacterium]|nr:cyclase family protein [bacterium]
MGWRIVDLSQEIFNGMPVYPGHQRTALFPNKTHEETSYAYKDSPSGHTSTTNTIIMSDHGPTHVDAFVHIDKKPGAESIDQMGLEWFFTEAICLDLSKFCNTDAWMTPEDLEEACKKASLEVPAKGAVLIWTGHYEANYGGDFNTWLYKYPGLNEAAMNWLADRGCINVGIDSPSVDSSLAMKDRGYWAHKVCRERKVTNVENLANLKEVAGTKFIFSCLPLKMRGGTGSPVRAVAIYME